MEIPADTLNNALLALRALGVCPYFWMRGTQYTERDVNNIRDSNVFVIILPENKWKINPDHLTAGTLKELRLAHKLGKRIYLAYKPQHTGKMQIYLTDANRWKNFEEIDLISGLSGSTSEFEEQCPNNAPQKRAYEPSVQDKIRLENEHLKVESKLIYGTDLRRTPDLRLLLAR